MRRQLIWALLLAAASFGLASAQETTSGSIAGTVVDAQGVPVPGANVTITSAQGPRTMVTDAAGRFFAPYLTPGRYSVRVELSGFQPVERKNVDVRLGQRYDIGDLSLRVGGIEETVEVVGAAPVVDTTSTTVGGILDGEAIKKLPVGRNFTDTLYLVPGVSDSSYAGRSNPSIGGASGLENNYIVDGVNVSNTGFGAMGSFSRQYPGQLGTGVTSEFIKETQVKTGGFEAEFGQATGGVVNVVTQSGTNEFRGSVFGYWRPSTLESSWRQLETPNGTVNTQGTDNADFGVSLGGPLVRDRLFVFGTFNPNFETITRTAPPDFPLAGQEFDRKRKSYSYAGKLTWQLSPNHRFEGSFYGDPSKAEVGPQRNNALLADSTSRFSSIDYGGHRQSVKYDGIVSTNWLVELAFGHSSDSVSETPAEDTYSTTDQTVVPNRRSGGIGFYEDDHGNNYQASFKSTNLFDAGGRHQVRYGVLYEDIDYFQGTKRTGQPFTLSDGQRTASGGSLQIIPDPVRGRIFRISRADLSPGRDTTQRYWSAFLQDTWTIGSRLTLRPGIRWDYQGLKGSEAFPACHEGTERMGEVGPGASIACHYSWKNNFAPRIGATYDIKGNGKSKLFASYGRFYVKIPNDMAARALAADAGVTRADYFDAGLTQPIPQGVLAGPGAGTTNHLTLAGLHPATFENDIKSTYSDEWLGGAEFEVARNLSVGVRYVNRRIPVVMEDFAPAQVLLYADAGSIEYLVDNITTETPTLDPRDFGQTFAQAHFENPVHKYQAVELTLNKAFSDNWSLMTSYRWSKLEGNFEGFFRSDNGQADPGITSLFDFPTNDPSYTEVGAVCCDYRGDIRYQGTTLGSGRLPNDRPHQFKAYANYAFGNLNTGIGLNVGSGRSLTALAANPGYTNSGEIPETLRGEGFDTVDGFKTRTKTETYFDAHVDYTFKLGGDRRMVLLADAFNLFNTQDPLDYDNYTELTFQTPNPDFGQPKAGGGFLTQYHVPRQVRLGVRFEW
jgi:hypothetical protein